MTGQPYIAERRTRVHIPGIIRIPWSYFITGAYILSRGDNASFLLDATEDYRGKPVPKLTRARWRRVARRHAALTMPPLLAVATPSWVWRGYVLLLMAAALAWVVWQCRSSLCGWRQNREWIDPAARVACAILNVRYLKRRARRMIELPPGWGTGADGEEARQVARLHIPPGTPLSAGVKKQLTEQVGARLGIPKPVQGDWQEAGNHVQVELAAAPVPPKTVTYADLEKAIREAAEDEVILGREAGGRLVSISLAEDAPHVLMSGASGTGKSVLGRVFMVQRAALGDGLMILDPKKFSHWRWAGGGKLSRDRVVYAYRTEDIHDAWIAVGQEAERRIELPEEELEKQRRVFVTVEEINVQTKRLARYWKGKRREIMAAAKEAKEQGMDYDPADLDPPLTSPAIVAMQESVGMGRELRMHVVVMAQRASAAVFGGNGGDIRESFQGGRLVAKWDRKLWKMLVDTIEYVACPPGPRGIWGLARGEDFHIFRVPFLSDAEALAIVQKARPVHGPVLGQQQMASGHVDSTVVGHSEKVAISSAVTLATALDMLPGQDGPRAITLASFRVMASRDGFPRPLAKPDGSEYGRTEARLYDLAELVEWREQVLAR
jgi:hypothetical protein